MFEKTFPVGYIVFSQNATVIELFVDEKFAGRTSIKNDTIWDDYNGHTLLTSGKSKHGTAGYYKGCINEIMFVDKAINPRSKTISLITNNHRTFFHLIGNGKIYNFNLFVKKIK